jgi:hypothetical protein
MSHYVELVSGFHCICLGVKILFTSCYLVLLSYCTTHMGTNAKDEHYANITLEVLWNMPDIHKVSEVNRGFFLSVHRLDYIDYIWRVLVN